MKEQLAKAIEAHRAAIVAAVATLDEIAQEQQRLQKQAEALKRKSVELQQLQQVALREKLSAQAALAALEDLEQS